MTTELFTKGYDSQNEDYCKVVELEGRTLVIMADGMGGLSLGAEAAECVCEAIAEYASKHLDAEDLWQETFKYADNKLRELSLASHSNMGAAVTALIITEASCVVAWQGNVRLYIHRNNELQQITTDHVIDDGYGHKLLTRCLKGSGLRGEVSYSILPLHSGDTLYMCTDGFYNVQEAEIAKGEVPTLAEECIFTDDASCLTIKI